MTEWSRRVLLLNNVFKNNHDTHVTERRSLVSNPSIKTTVRNIHVVFQVESHMRDDCAMTVVLCPYEGAGCTFHVSSVVIERFGNHFVVAD